MSGSELTLPVKVAPFDHQRKAFEFVLWLFGMVDGTVRMSFPNMRISRFP